MKPSGYIKISILLFYLTMSFADGQVWKGKRILLHFDYSDIRFQSPHTDQIDKKVRFIKYTFIKGVPGIWEFKIY
jgi:hypothetical protein